MRTKDALKYICGLFCLFSFCSSAALAQTRFLVGVDGGSSVGNLYIGPKIGVEQFVGNHFEARIGDSFAPVEEHIKLGNGWANKATSEDIVWFNRTVGLNSKFTYGMYRTSIYKSAGYAFGGLKLNQVVQGVPVQYTIDYVRQIRNGIDKTGTETAHLQGGEFDMDITMSCDKHFCTRLQWTFGLAHVLNQGNPQCDGTYGPVQPYCVRQGAIGGTFTGAFVFEFPGRKN